MDDDRVQTEIERLVSEEQQLLDDEARDGATEQDRQRLEAVRVSLDRCWDLLRQRRALSEAVRNADDASARDSDVVERYEQ